MCQTTRPASTSWARWIASSTTAYSSPSMGLNRSGETAVIGTFSSAAIDETLVMLILLLAATATAVATGLGAIPVFFLGDRAAGWQPALYGLAAGAMTVASIVGLLKP